jgi:hypothetical protein
MTYDGLSTLQPAFSRRASLADASVSAAKAMTSA